MGGWGESFAFVFKKEIDSRISVCACLGLCGSVHMVCVHVDRAVCSVYTRHLCASLGLCAGDVCMPRAV